MSKSLKEIEKDYGHLASNVGAMLITLEVTRVEKLSGMGIPSLLKAIEILIKTIPENMDDSGEVEFLRTKLVHLAANFDTIRKEK